MPFIHLSFMRLSAVWLLTATLLAPGAALASEMTFLTHNLQGQTFVDDRGEIRGNAKAGKRAFNVELVRAMMAILDHPKRISEAPLARGLLMIEQEANVALFNVSRTSDRENRYRWVGPLQTEVDHFFGLKGKSEKLLTHEAARNVKAVCVVNGGVHHDILQRMGYENLVAAKSYVDCFRLLKLERVQLTPSAATAVTAKAEEAQLSLDAVHRTPIVILDSSGYIAFSKRTPEVVVQHWQQALDALKSSGVFESLRNRYLPDPLH